jgi:hypothetical protein
LWNFLTEHSKVKLKNNGDKTFPSFRPFWVGNGSDGCVSKAPSPKVIKSMMMISTGHVACMREKRNAYRILVGKPE